MLDSTVVSTTGEQIISVKIKTYKRYEYENFYSPDAVVTQFNHHFYSSLKFFVQGNINKKIKVKLQFSENIFCKKNHISLVEKL